MISIYAGIGAIAFAVVALLAIFKPAALWVLLTFAVGALAVLVFLLDPPLGEWLRWWRMRRELEEDEG